MDIKTFEKVKMKLAEEYIRNKSLRNNITKKFEDELMEKYLQKGIINELVVFWKAGRLIPQKDNAGGYIGYIPATNNNGDYYTGYGTVINSDELKEYLINVKKLWSELNAGGQ